MRHQIPKWVIVLLVVTVFAVLMTWNIKMDEQYFEEMASSVIGLFIGQYGDLVLIAYALGVGAICTFGSELIARKSGKRREF